MVRAQRFAGSKRNASRVRNATFHKIETQRLTGSTRFLRVRNATPHGFETGAPTPRSGDRGAADGAAPTRTVDALLLPSKP